MMPLKVGVAGTGTMGRGIMQLMLEAGHEVYFFDATPGAAARAAEQVLAMLARAVDKGRLSRDVFAAMPKRLHALESPAAFAPCGIVIEAIVEDLGAKQALFRELETVLDASAILATNTSSLLVSAIAASCRHPERVAGLHFFNPVPLMKVAEVIPGVRTGAAAIDALKALISAAGHRPVVSADQPGFLVNHAGRGLYTEGLRILEEGVADTADIDALLRDAAGFRMGPFELLDLTGLDVSGKVMQSIYDQFQHEARFRPSSLVPPRIAAGLLGRKSGRGWYDYGGETPPKASPPTRAASAEGAAHATAAPEAARAPDAAGTLHAAGTLPKRVWIDPLADERDAIAELVRAAGATSSQAPDADVLVTQFWGADASGHCAAHGLDARRCVAIDPLPGLSRHRTLMLTTATRAAVRDAAAALFSADGTAVTVINDSCGFVVQRVLSTIVNIAADIAQRRIATVPDIEEAVQLGLGYPWGPLGWGDHIGPRRVLSILEGLQSTTGDARYRPSPWLRRRAALGISLLCPEPGR